MKRPPLSLMLPVLAAVLGAAAVSVWLFEPRTDHLQLRLPGQEDRLTSGETVQSTAGRNSGTLIPGSGTASAIVGSWPQFRGADRTNIVHDAGPLARAWPEDGPEVLWSVEVGEGHAGAAIHNGRVYLVDYDREKQEDAIRCLSLDDAGEIWRYTYYVKVKRNHGMSRTVPAVNGRYLVALGPKCHVHCLDALTGELIWKIDLVEEFGAEVPPWYAGQCPLIDGDVVILAPGGDALMMAIELETGRILWRTPNPGGWKMTHSSIVPMDYKGTRQYIYCSTRGVVSVAAEDGRILWTNRDWVIKLATVPSPVIVGEDRIFLSGGYNSGCMMLRLNSRGDTLETEELFRLKAVQFGADQHTPILYQDHIYGVRPGGELACLDLEGNRLWTSGGAKRFGLGPFLLADGLLFILDDEHGVLRLVEATPTGYNELAQAKLLQGHDAWGPMAMVAGRLILRDATTMVCVKAPELGR